MSSALLSLLPSLLPSLPPFLTTAIDVRSAQVKVVGTKRLVLVGLRAVLKGGREEEGWGGIE